MFFATMWGDGHVYVPDTGEVLTLITPIIVIAEPRSSAAHCAFEPGSSGPLCEDGWPLGNVVTCEMICAYQAHLDHGRTFYQAEQEWLRSEAWKQARIDLDDEEPFA